MQYGQIVHIFTAKDGQQVILRTPKREDLDDFVTLINSLITERADILLEVPVTRNAEIDWLSQKLAAIEKGEVIQIVAEINDQVIATTDVTIKTGARSHVGDIGIIILKDFRDVGIGTEMLKQLLAQAQEQDIKIVTLSVFETNTRAQHVYEKLGFQECGRVPCEIHKNGHYIDYITMVKILDKTITSY